MLRPKCLDSLTIEAETFLCERREGHRGKHRESAAGWDGTHFRARMTWERRDDMGGKPNRGTKRDRRLKENRRKPKTKKEK